MDKQHCKSKLIIVVQLEYIPTPLIFQGTWYFIHNKYIANLEKKTLHCWHFCYLYNTLFISKSGDFLSSLLETLYRSQVYKNCIQRERTTCSTESEGGQSQSSFDDEVNSLITRFRKSLCQDTHFPKVRPSTSAVSTNIMPTSAVSDAVQAGIRQVRSGRRRELMNKLIWDQKLLFMHSQYFH